MFLRWMIKGSKIITCHASIVVGFEIVINVTISIIKMNNFLVRLTVFMMDISSDGIFA